MFVPEVFEFDRLIDQKKYVLTYSFHDTAFSMKQNTEHICLYAKAFGGYLDSSLKLLGYTYRYVWDFDAFISYTVVWIFREKVSDYITRVLKATEKYYQAEKSIVRINVRMWLCA